MRISLTPSPTGLQSPKFPIAAASSLVRIRATPFASFNFFNQSENTSDRISVFNDVLQCIRVDTDWQIGRWSPNDSVRWFLDVARKSPSIEMSRALDIGLVRTIVD
jgi:hypothetical protein